MTDTDLLSQLRVDASDREDTEGRGRWLWLAAVVVALVVVAAASWWLMAGKVVAVETVTASTPAASGSGNAVLQATGYVVARRKATVSAQIVGTLTDVLIEEGDHVAEGQVLARLEDSAQSARLTAARASAAAAAAEVRQLELQHAQATRESGRLQDLVARGLVSDQAAEKAGTHARALAAQLASAKARQKAAEAQVAVAQVNYDYTVVRAPFAGVITQKTAQVGEIIAPSAAGGGFTRTGVGTIVDMSSLEVEVDVNESYISRVAPAMPAEAVLDAYPDWTIPAHVIAIVPTANRAKATVKVRVALESTDPRIIPEMGVRVTFLDSEPAAAGQARPAGVLVPASAIVARDGHNVVFVVREGVAHAIRVTPAAETFGDLRRLPSAVDSGAQVVRAPSSRLADGDKVRIEPQS